LPAATVIPSALGRRHPHPRSDHDTTGTTTTENLSRPPPVRPPRAVHTATGLLPSPTSRLSHGWSRPVRRPRPTPSHQSEPQLYRSKQRRRRVKPMPLRTRTVSTAPQGMPSYARTAPPYAFRRRPNHRIVTSSSARTAPSCVRSPTNLDAISLTRGGAAADIRVFTTGSLTASGVGWHRDPQRGDPAEVQPQCIRRTD
jgi:hypothetical protein